MTFEEFQDSLRHDAPPKALNLGLAALWWDGKGDWARLTNQRSRTRVHADLHRKEGDAANAAYWYQRAGRLPHESR